MLAVGTKEKLQIMNQVSTNGEERTTTNIGIICTAQSPHDLGINFNKMQVFVNTLLN